MSKLPKISTPLYELTLPLTKKKIKFRPFLVKEEKILLMAVESEDENAVLLAIKQIVNNCVVDELDVDNLPMTDLEFIFLNLRARSIGEIVELQYKCNNTVKDETGNDGPCNNIVKFELNLLDIKPTVPENHSKTISLSDEIGVIMKYPDFNTVLSVDKTKNEIDVVIDMIILCIESIYDKETVYHTKDATLEEIQEFLESLNNDQFKKVQEFFTSIPTIKQTLKFVCPKCNYTEDIEVEGVQNFFS